MRFFLSFLLAYYLKWDYICTINQSTNKYMNIFDKLQKSQEELDKLMQEFSLVSNMSEAQACDYLNTDSKADALEAIQCEIDFYKSEVEEYQSEIDQENEEPTYGLDPAFGSWAEVNAMFI